MILENSVKNRPDSCKNIGHVFDWGIACFLMILSLTSCSTSGRLTSIDIQIAELNADHQYLQDDYTKMKAQLENLNGFTNGQDFLETKQTVKVARFTEGGETLKQVLERNFLHCGSHDTVPGFGFFDPEQDEFVGFDIDFCRAVAAAIFGPEGANAIKFVPLISRHRFSSLQIGEIDLLIRNTTWTLTRDSVLGLAFGPITFYDGQGIMVPIDRGFNELEDLAEQTVCMIANTTIAQNVLQAFAKLDVQIEIRTFEDRDRLREAYENEICAGLSADKSVLLGYKQQLSNPDNHKIFSDKISREPLAPMVRQGDDNWHDIIFWTVQCTINAEYLGISQKNVESLRGSSNSHIQRLLGVGGDLGQAMGLNNDFCYQVIAQVGNYAEIYDRHFGADTPFGLPRGLNALFPDGGILYPIPFR